MVLMWVRYGSTMTDNSGIRQAFVEAYPQYVARLLLDRGVEIGPTVADGIVAGTETLDRLLATLESRSPGLERHSPLELFREALRPVGDALDVAGVEPPLADTNQRALLPWDRYGLSPGSARQIGEAAHEAHLQWGIAKVRAHAVRPTAGLRCSVADAPRLLEQLNQIGYRVIRLPSDESVSVALVDIRENGVDQIVAPAASAGGHVIVFGDDLNDFELERFKALGASAVVVKRELLDDLASHIPSIV